MTHTNHRTQAPYDILTAQQALIEAANINRRLTENVDEPEMMGLMAQVALSLATYALALRGGS